MKIKHLFFILLMFDTFFAFNQNIKIYTLSLDIQPSFQERKRFTIQRDQNKCMFNESIYKFTEKDSMLIGFFSELDSIVSHYKVYYLDNSGYTKETGAFLCTDGIDTYGSISFKDSVLSFRFHTCSIDYDSCQIKLIDNFFNISYYLLRNTLLEKTQNENELKYLEDIEPEIGIRAFRRISKEPLIYWLNERVSDYKSTVDLISSFPEDKKIIIETGSHFAVYSIDNYFIPLKNYILTRNDIYWIASGDAKKELILLGVNRKYIYTNISNIKFKE